MREQKTQTLRELCIKQIAHNEARNEVRNYWNGPIFMAPIRAYRQSQIPEEIKHELDEKVDGIVKNYTWFR